jgi:peptidoglycan/LPS O-acetylase OafA/YrhL
VRPQADTVTEIRALTGLRGVAALIVFWAHMRATLGEHGLELTYPLVVERLFMMGGRQVDIFFVLSGFILVMIYRSWFAESLSASSYWTFQRRRLARIYPLHAFMLLLVIAFVVAARHANIGTSHGLDRFDFSTLPAHFLLVHAWGLFIDGDGEWNPPSWSISIEAMAYLVLPFLIWSTARWMRSRPWLLIAMTVAVGFGLNALTHWGTYGFAGIARGLSEFALGCATVNLVDSDFARSLQSSTGSWLMLAIVLIGFALVPDTGFIIAMLTAPLLLSLCGDNGVSRMFGMRVIFFLGEISYSIYLGHFLFSSVAYRLVSIEWMKHSPLATLAGIALIVGFVLVCSTMTYYLIERPGRDFFSGRRKKRVAAA